MHFAYFDDLLKRHSRPPRPHDASRERCFRIFPRPWGILFLSLVFTNPASIQGQWTDELRVQQVILTNGRVFAGLVERHPSQVIVRTSSGAVIPLDRSEVDFVADTIEDAADRLSNRLVDDRPETRISLAMWCLQHGAARGAEREITWLETWGVQSPEVDELRRRLERLIPEVSPSANLADANPRVRSLPPAIPEKALSPADVTLAAQEPWIERMSADAKAAFQSDVHRRLVNGCAAARCHGNPSRPFQLWADGIHGGLATTGSRKNLAATLAQLDRNSPDQSPLLHFISSTHGGQTQPGYVRGSREWNEIRFWANAVVAEERLGRTGQQIASSGTDPEPAGNVSGPPPTGTRQEIPSAVKPVTWNQPDGGPASGLPTAKTPPEPVNLHETTGTRRTTSDPFDPEVFNRKYATRSQPAANRFNPDQLPSAQPVPPAEMESPAAAREPAPVTGKKIRPLPPAGEDDSTENR